VKLQLRLRSAAVLLGIVAVLAAPGALAQTTFRIPVIATNAPGPAKPFGDDMLKGIQLAVDQANSAREIPNITLALDVSSTPATADPQAIQAMNTIAQSNASVVLFGTSSATALAVAPIAQRAGIPFVATQSGADGLMGLGDRIFRTTAPQFTYQGMLSQYFKAKGVKRVAIMYNADNPTLTAVATQTFPAAASRDGYEIVRTTSFSATETNFQPIVRQALAANPDAILFLSFGPQNASMVNEFRLANFTGLLASQPAGGVDIMVGLGAKADGIVYATDFSPAAADSQKFVSAYQAKYGANTIPNSFAATGYDGARLIIEALKVAKSLDRPGMLEALNATAASGYQGAGSAIKFDKRDARVNAVVVEWRNGRETIAK
jgi:branched-chain amino acid transport system substrate-binding protein